MTADDIKTAYERVKAIKRDRLRSDDCAQAITGLVEASVEYLDARDRIPLSSKVPGKEYVAFGSKEEPSRPVNKIVLDTGWKEALKNWEIWTKAGYDKEVFGEDQDRFSAMLYLVSIAPCLVFDLINRNDKKRSATYFERLVGHVVSAAIESAPAKARNSLSRARTRP